MCLLNMLFLFLNLSWLDFLVKRHEKLFFHWHGKKKILKNAISPKTKTFHKDLNCPFCRKKRCPNADVIECLTTHFHIPFKKHNSTIFCFSCFFSPNLFFVSFSSLLFVASFSPFSIFLFFFFFSSFIVVLVVLHCKLFI